MVNYALNLLVKDNFYWINIFFILLFTLGYTWVEISVYKIVPKYLFIEEIIDRFIQIQFIYNLVPYIWCECCLAFITVGVHFSEKPKRKSKKRKTADLENIADKEVEFTEEIHMDLNIDSNRIDNDLNVLENNELCAVENDSFVAEEEAFNEWLQLCKPNNNIVLNDQFFKLLNLFTDSSMDSNRCENELSQKNNNLLFHSSNNLQEMGNSKTVVDQINIAKESVSVEYVSDNINSIDSADDLFISQKLNGIGGERLRQDGVSIVRNVRLNDDDQTDTVTVKNDEDENDSVDDDVDLGNVNFGDLFKSQRADMYIEEYNDKIIAEQINDDYDDSIIFIEDESRSPVARESCEVETVNSKHKDSVYVNATGFGISSKSQKYDTRVQEHGDKIAAGQINYDSDDSIVLINDKPRSSERYNVHRKPEASGRPGKKTVENNFKSQRHNTEDNALDVVIDISNDNSTSVGRKGTGRIDYGVLFKGHRSDGYIEDYMEKGVVPRSVNAVTVTDDANDDVIFLDDSPDFLNRKRPKKTVQTKLTDRLTGAPAAGELIDLSLPRQPADRVAGLRLPTGGQPDGDGAAAGSGLLDEDDDMDFMFLDYCGSGGSGFVTQIERTGHGHVDDDVLTQKPPAGDDDGVFTQRPRADDKDVEDDVFTQRRRDYDGSGAADVSAPREKRPGRGLVDGVFKERASIVGGTTAARRSHQSSRAAAATASPAAHGSDSKSVAKTAPPKTAAKTASSASGATITAPPKTAALPRSADTSRPRPFDAGPLQPFNTLKACQLFKPGFSLKRGTAGAAAGKKKPPAPAPVKTSPAVRGTPEDDASPLQVPGKRRRRPEFSQSTPKVASAGGQPQVKPAAKVLLLTSSSSDSDVFVGGAQSTIRRGRVKKKRRPKPKKVSVPPPRLLVTLVLFPSLCARFRWIFLINLSPRNRILHHRLGIFFFR